jgi:hypothetical protein
MSIGRNVPAVTVDAVTLQWANGKTVARSTPADGRFSPLVGFHIEAGKDEELDKRLHTMGFTRIEIKHQRSGGSEIKVHWFIGETLRLFPVTSGPPAPTVAGCIQRSGETGQAGLGARWPDGERSQLAVRGYVDELINAGYLQPVQLTTKSRMTDVLLGCLIDHVRVCEAADGLIDRNRHPAPVDLHEIALPLGADVEQEWGKGDTATVVPFKSLHPAEITVEYLRGTWRPEPVNSAAHRDWTSILEWATAYTAGTPTHPEEVL